MKVRRSLCTLSGDDWGIVKQCSPRRQWIFSAIGLSVLVIFGLCFASSFITFVQLFQSYWTGIPAGLFFAFMITNIYLLLLYTLTQNMIPCVESRSTRKLSLVVRVIFLIFIAIVVSKPIEASIFSGQVNSEVLLFKSEQLRRFEAVNDDFFDREIQQLQSFIDQEKRLNNGAESSQIEKERKMMLRRGEEKIVLKYRMRELVNNSNYFIQGIVLLNSKYPYCWVITILIAILFCTPAVLKNLIPTSANFYKLKKSHEIELIRSEYSMFLQRYSTIFRERFGEERDFVEIYEDPPFNTVRKVDAREFLAQDVLLKQFYNA